MFIANFWVRFHAELPEGGWIVKLNSAGECLRLSHHASWTAQSFFGSKFAFAKSDLPGEFGSANFAPCNQGVEERTVLECVRVIAY